MGLIFIRARLTAVITGAIMTIDSLSMSVKHSSASNNGNERSSYYILDSSQEVQGQPSINTHEYYEFLSESNQSSAAYPSHEDIHGHASFSSVNVEGQSYNEMRKNNYQIKDRHEELNLLIRHRSQEERERQDERLTQIAKEIGRPKYRLKRELGHARIVLRKPKLEIDEWLDLIRCRDEKALQCLRETTEDIVNNSRRTCAKFQLRQNINNQYAANKLKELGQSKEEFVRQKVAKYKLYPVSKTKRDSVNHVINKFREDVEMFNRGMDLRRETYTKMDMELKRSKKEKKQEAKYERGDALADHIIEVVRKARSKFLVCPFDPDIREMWGEVDQWMSEYQRKYVKIKLPESLEESSVKEDRTVQSDRREKGKGQIYEPVTLDRETLNSICQGFASRKAFTDSLFHDQGNDPSFCDEDE